MASNYMTNSEVVDYLGLPDSIITDLQTAQGDAFSAKANEFINALVNKIVYQTIDGLQFSNPFKQYDSFPVQYGDTIENIFCELPKGYTYDKDNTDPFVKVVPSVKTLYSTINYEMQYCLTIQDVLLRRATLNEYGFMNLINSLLVQLTNSRDIDEYFSTISMLNNAELYANSTGDIGSKQFGELDLSAYGTDTEKAKALTKDIIDITSSFTLPSTNNNALKVMSSSSLDNVLLLIRRDLYNSINLDYLAGVYNLSKVDLIKKIIVVESFKVKNASGETKGEDLGFIVMDTRAFDNHVALQDGGMIYNPKGKYTNHFTNLWKVISFKYFYNAVAKKVKVNV